MYSFKFGLLGRYQLKQRRKCTCIPYLNPPKAMKVASFQFWPIPILEISGYAPKTRMNLIIINIRYNAIKYPQSLPKNLSLGPGVADTKLKDPAEGLMILPQSVPPSTKRRLKDLLQHYPVVSHITSREYEITRKKNLRVEYFCQNTPKVEHHRRVMDECDA